MRSQTTAEIPISKPMQRLSAYMAGALGERLPAEIEEHAKLHILDTLAAIISGSRLLAGQKAIEYVSNLGGGRAEALVLGTSMLTTTTDAALANGMSGHADETDDSHAPALLHPGCIVLPAALAAAEKWQRSGTDLLRATALGYDLGVRFSLVLGAFGFHTSGRSTPGMAGLFGAGGAAAALAGLDAAAMRHVLAYSAQQASGLTTWLRDRDHIEKAFVFGGMPARNGMAAAAMVAAGLTGVDDVLAGVPNFLGLYSIVGGTPEMLVDGLGENYEIGRTNIKKWCVGSPVQAALDAVQTLMRDSGIRPDTVGNLRVHLPKLAVAIVDRTAMADLDVRYLIAVLLVDGDLSFSAAHDHARKLDPQILELRGKIDVIPSDELESLRPERQSIVEVDLTDGRRLSHRTYAVRGTQKNPMTREEIEAKARDLLAPVIGTFQANNLISAIRILDTVEDIRSLRPLLSA